MDGQSWSLTALSPAEARVGSRVEISVSDVGPELPVKAESAASGVSLDLGWELMAWPKRSSVQDCGGSMMHKRDGRSSKT